MPSKKNRAKASKQQCRNTFQDLNHQENTPQMRKIRNANASYEVQRLLGRPIKRYNLLYSQDDGDWFSSEDNLEGGDILRILREKGIKDKNCGYWQMAYKIKSKNMPENHQFFFYANLADNRSTQAKLKLRTGVAINKYEYFMWKDPILSEQKTLFCNVKM